MSRSECMDWWKARQRCVDTKRRFPEVFAEAVETDTRMLSRLALDNKPYLHIQRMLLAQAVALDETNLGADGQRNGFGN